MLPRHRDIVAAPLRAHPAEARRVMREDKFQPVDVARKVDVVSVGTGTITVSGASTVGSGVMVVDYTLTNGGGGRVYVVIPPGNDSTQAAVLVAAALDLVAELTSTSAVDDVTLDTTDGGDSIATMVTRSGVDSHVFQRYTGTTYSVLTLTTSPNQRVTGSVTVVAGEPELDYLPITGATYVTAGSGATFTAPEVLELTVGALPGIQTACWASLTITMDSRNREIS